MLYIDSSVLLAIYFSEAKADAALAVLNQNEDKVSSWILAIEVPVVLGRTLGPRPSDQALLDKALSRFDHDLRTVSLFAEMADLAERVRHDQRLSACRTLDAIHLGSALQLQAMTSHPVRVVTLDRRMAEVAAQLGLSLHFL
jgi:predicted nucleic acid-binding protein